MRLLVGDVVWGKIHGFPWWPGKILTMTSCGGQSAQAHVAWYGSSTSSLMQCDQLSHYLDNFKVSLILSDVNYLSIRRYIGYFNKL